MSYTDSFINNETTVSNLIIYKNDELKNKNIMLLKNKVGELNNKINFISKYSKNIDDEHNTNIITITNNIDKLINNIDIIVVTNGQLKSKNKKKNIELEF